MVISFNKFREAEPPVLTLCNPGCVYNAVTEVLSNAVGVVAEANDVNIRYAFNTPSEMSFSIHRPHDPDALQVYNGVQNRRLIFAEGIGFYYITEVITTESDEGVQKQVTAQSCEIDLMRKVVPYIDSGKAYSLSGCMDLVRAEFPEWDFPSAIDGSTNPIPQTVANRERIFEELDDDLNVYTFLMQELQKAFGCIFEFDYTTRIVTCYDASTYVGESLAYIPGDGLADSISVTRTSEDVCTALTVSGDNNLTIANVNPLGDNTVYDFSYFYDQMEPELALKVAGWQAAITSAEEPYRALNAEYAATIDDIVLYQTTIAQYDALTHVYQMCVDNVTAGIVAGLDSEAAIEGFNGTISNLNGDELSPQSNIDELRADVTDEIARAEQERAAAESALASAEANKSSLLEQINALKESLSFEANFTASEREVLAAYRLDGYWNYEYATITDSMDNTQAQTQAVVLYEAAKSQLELINTPTVEVNADMREFVFIKDYETLTNALSVGRHKLDLEMPDGTCMTLLLTSIDVGYTDNAFELTFANRAYKPDNSSLYDDLFGEVSRSTNAISREKSNIYPVVGPRLNALRVEAQNALNISLTQAILADNQTITLDDTGYLGTVEEDGVSSDEQIKITNNSIVFTNDSWSSAVTAVGPVAKGYETHYGINAKTILGNIVAGVTMQIGGDETVDLGETLDLLAAEADNIDKAVGTQSNWLTFDDTSGLIIGQRVSDENGVKFYSAQTGAEYKMCSTASAGVPIVDITAEDAKLKARIMQARDMLCVGGCEFISSTSGLAIKWRR